jgi:hypothetical protein
LPRVFALTVNDRFALDIGQSTKIDHKTEETPVTFAPRRLAADHRAPLPRLHVGRILFLVIYTVAWAMMVYGAQLFLRRLF